ncbi:MAG: hypothetical protein WC607_00715 [Candidatus Micrarchaeia archaeon]
MKAFALSLEAFAALLLALGLLAFALPSADSDALRVHEYRLCQDAAQIAVNLHQSELVAFWRSGEAPVFLVEIAREAGATGYAAEAGGRAWGAACTDNAFTAERMLFDSGEYARMSITLCYP